MFSASRANHSVIIKLKVLFTQTKEKVKRFKNRNYIKRSTLAQKYSDKRFRMGFSRFCMKKMYNTSTITYK